MSPSDRVAALKASLSDDSPRRKAEKKNPEIFLKSSPDTGRLKPAKVQHEQEHLERVNSNPPESNQSKQQHEQTAVSEPAEAKKAEAVSSKPVDENQVDKSQKNKAVHVGQSWEDIVPRLGIAGIQLELANNCALRAIEEKKVRLVLLREYESLLQPVASRQLEAALTTFLGREISLDIVVESGDFQTPARIRQQLEAEKLEAARQSIEQDPLVQTLCEELDGVVQSGSIKSLE